MEYGVDRLIYISCKPTSLVRDLELIKMYGYEVTRAACVDQFPWTANTETVCLLGKNVTRSKSRVNLSLEVEDYYRIKDSEKESELLHGR
jgi:23S rRNA (uracil1939-C5)-methyltransferase